jgi:hypothetical protein
VHIPLSSHLPQPAEHVGLRPLHLAGVGRPTQLGGGGAACGDRGGVSMASLAGWGASSDPPGSLKGAHCQRGQAALEDLRDPGRPALHGVGGPLGRGRHRITMSGALHDRGGQPAALARQLLQLDLRAPPRH